MIDLHSHYLPDIDDGARNIEESIELIKHSVENGVTAIMATPHLNIGRFDNDLKKIDATFSSFAEVLKNLHLEVQIAYAAEVRICPEIIILAKKKQLPFIGKYNCTDLLLLEFPDSHIPPGSDKLVKWLLANSITPIIAHPERNRELWQHPYLINDFIKLGCLLQLTAGSIIGDFGKRPEKLALQYLVAGQVFIIASDMHNMKRRPNRMAEAYQLLSENFSKAFADKLCVSNPEKVFNSNPTKLSL